MYKIGKTLRAVGGAIYMLSFLSLFGFDYYFRTFPIVPDPQRGLTATYISKGTNHYITQSLRDTYNCAWAIAAASFITTALGVYLVDHYKPAKNSN
jgi:hypothetical protein